MLGIFSKTTDSNFIEAAGYSGLDFIILDQEHGPATLETINNHVRASKVSGIKTFVRVATNCPSLIGAALDTGADGVQIPNISSYDEALAAVKAARFYPQGMRGVCRFVKAAEFGTKDKAAYFKEANTKTIILQVEGKDGVEALDDILSIVEFDVLFIGPYDLSQSLGHPGEIDHPEVNKFIKQIADKVKMSEKKLATFSDNLESAIRLKNMGFEIIAYSVDINIYTEACKTLKSKVK